MYYASKLSQMGGSVMSYIDPSLKEQFESLPTELKNNILERNVHLNTMTDLVAVLEDIAKES